MMRGAITSGDALDFTIMGQLHHPKTEHDSDLGFVGNLDMGIFFTFKQSMVMASVVFKSTITPLIKSNIVTDFDFDLLNNCFRIQQG